MAGIINGSLRGSRDYREYLTVKLSSPLEIGEKYLAEMYFSLGDNSMFACNNIGMYFSNTLISSIPPFREVLNFSPLVNESSIITDSINWVKLRGSFKASSSLQYLLIGNFFNDSSTSLASIPSIIHWYTYYFIDDIAVRKVSFNLPNDTILRLGDSVQLSATADSPLGWAIDTAPAVILSSDQIISVSPSIKTTYLAYNKWDTASVTVDVHPERFLELGNDITLCYGDSITIDASTTSGEYKWQEGSTDSSLTLVEGGNYWVEVSQPCGPLMDTISIDFIDCDFYLDMPNIFTPNNDGVNDYFFLMEINKVTSGELLIFNRHGQKVYAGSIDSQGWNGSFNGQPCTQGVYYWVVTYYYQTGTSKMNNGNHTLTR